MLDVPSMAWSVGALIVGLLAGHIAFYAGYFHITLRYFHLPGRCPAAFRHLCSRWLLFYTPPLLMLPAAAWMMPHWSLAAPIVAYVLYRLHSGAWFKIRKVADELTDQCIKTLAPFGSQNIPIRRTHPREPGTVFSKSSFRYYLGQPVLMANFEPDFYCPTNQVDSFLQVLKETQDWFEVRHILSREYIAIASTMLHMGIDFTILCSHPRYIDHVLLRALKNLGLALEINVSSLGLLPDDFTWARDLYTVFPRQTLVNARLMRPGGRTSVHAFRAQSSPYGEGGRVLFTGRTAIVSDRIVNEDGISHDSESDISRITSEGFRVGRLANWVARKIAPSGTRSGLAVHDHNDLNSALLSGRDGSLHLLVDPTIQLAHWIDNEDWRVLSTQESTALVNDMCERLRITVHRPEITVPFALNLEQFPDGRVLMTGGDECVAEAVRHIVGSENVFVTPVPIRYFPVWLNGGIHCLTNKIPPQPAER